MAEARGFGRLYRWTTGAYVVIGSLNLVLAGLQYFNRPPAATRSFLIILYCLCAVIAFAVAGLNYRRSRSEAARANAGVANAQTPSNG